MDERLPPIKEDRLDGPTGRQTETRTGADRSRHPVQAIIQRVHVSCGHEVGSLRSLRASREPQSLQGLSGESVVNIVLLRFVLFYYVFNMFYYLFCTTCYYSTFLLLFYGVFTKQHFFFLYKKRGEVRETPTEVLLTKSKE